MNDLDGLLKDLDKLKNLVRQDRNMVEDGISMKVEISKTPEEAVKRADYEKYMKSQQINASTEEELNAKIENIASQHIDSILKRVFED